MTNSELYEVVEQMKEAIGTEELLDALVQALSSQELEENLQYIDRMYDTDLL